MTVDPSPDAPEIEEGTAADAFCVGDPPPPTQEQLDRYVAARAAAPTEGVELLQWYRDLGGHGDG